MDDPLTTGPGPRTERGLATRRLLVRAALDRFADHGVEATSVDQITQSAQVAKGTFYVHFQRKQDVLLEWAAQLMGGVDTGGLPQEAPEAITVLGQRLAEEMVDQPRELLGRMVREVVGNSADWIRVLEGRPTLRAKIQPLVEEGQRQGTIRADMTARRLSMALTLLWLDNVVGWAERPHARPLPEALELATELFLHGAVEAGGGNG